MSEQPGYKGAREAHERTLVWPLELWSSKSRENKTTTLIVDGIE